ncbi:MAG: hypothetical protein ACK5HP_03925 [Bacilli bacterium]
MEYILDNYIWFIIGGVILLMTIIGYFAEKTDFGKNKNEKVAKVKPEKIKKGKIEKSSDIVEDVPQVLEQVTPVLNEENSLYNIDELNNENMFNKDFSANKNDLVDKTGYTSLEQNNNDLVVDYKNDGFNEEDENSFEQNDEINKNNYDSSNEDHELNNIVDNYEPYDYNNNDLDENEQKIVEDLSTGVISNNEEEFQNNKLAEDSNVENNENFEQELPVAIVDNINTVDNLDTNEKFEKDDDDFEIELPSIESLKAELSDENDSDDVWKF